jgi:hypothetical protein
MFLIFKVRTLDLPAHALRIMTTHCDGRICRPPLPFTHFQAVPQDGWVKDDIRQPNPVAVRKAVRRLLEPPPSIEDIEPPKVYLSFRKTNAKCEAAIVSWFSRFCKADAHIKGHNTTKTTACMRTLLSLHNGHARR